MNKQIELTDSKNQIQFYVHFGVLFFAVISIIFLIGKNYIQASIAALGFLITGFFVFVKKQNYKRIYFDENHLYFDAEKISLKSIRDIKISKWDKNHGVLKIEKLEKTENIYFAGYSKSNLELLKSFINRC
ncbi:hypothetical protein [Flavobacterium terrisoli]|uniref:hypothetical protein n=1 Tax=Flavobacterium terrisoli TaxID=3242195 RepID=UPI002542BC44|nr:hypothetical protein [Flavobacterium buctense]